MCMKRVFELTVVDVGPGVVGLDGEGAVVQHCEAVHDVGAEVGVDVAGPVFTDTVPVPGPVSEVTNNEVVWKEILKLAQI